MRLCDYEGNDKSKSFKNAINWLNTNKRFILKLAGISPFDKEFKKSSFWGMPRNIANHLTSKQIKYIQEQTKTWWFGKTSNVLNETIIAIKGK